MSPDRFFRSDFYWKWHVEIGLAVVTLFVTVMFLWVSTIRGDVKHQAELGAQSHAASCAFRDVLRSSVDQSKQILANDPTISPTQKIALRLSIHNQERTLRSLRILTQC